MISFKLFVAYKEGKDSTVVFEFIFRSLRITFFSMTFTLIIYKICNHIIL